MHNSYNIIADMAVASLLEEVETTPKPGLVDRRNSGAHEDMDYPLFVKSSRSLREYFATCAALGADSNNDTEKLSKKLRAAGIDAERKMFEATGGVNTQKGLVFSMGILCAGCGVILRDKSPICDESLKSLFAEISRALLCSEKPLNTNGHRVLEKTGVDGIRAEASSGFETCFEVGLPALKSALEEGDSFNTAKVKALLALMCRCSDSNVVHRAGLEGMTYIKDKAATILRESVDEETLLNKTSQFDDECIKKNISPGGAADLLALTLMIYHITNQKERLL